MNQINLQPEIISLQENSKKDLNQQIEVQTKLHQ